MTTQTPDGRTLTEWRTIPEFPKYQITPDGDVRNERTGRLVKEHQNRITGAYAYTLRKLMPDGRLKNYSRNYVSLVRDAWGEEGNA